MVGDKHDISHCIACVDSAAGIGNEQAVHAQKARNTDRVGCLLSAVALVNMHASLHDHDAAAAQSADNETARMVRHGRNGEMRNLTIRNDHRVLDLLSQISQAGTAESAAPRAGAHPSGGGYALRFQHSFHKQMT